MDAGGTPRARNNNDIISNVKRLVDTGTVQYRYEYRQDRYVLYLYVVGGGAKNGGLCVTL